MKWKRLDYLFLGKLGERVRLIKIWLLDGTLVYSTNKETRFTQIIVL
jgi:hypothetical protein